MFIGVDIGGSNMRAYGVKDLHNFQINSNDIHLAKPVNDFDKDFQALEELIVHVAEGENISGISMCVPGVVTKGLVSDVITNLPTWRDKPLAKMLSDKFECKVYLQNDSAAAALGEFYYGAGEGKKGFVFVIWGTGVGGTELKLVDGKPVAINFEPGYQYVFGQSQGKTFEDTVGGRGIRETYGKDAAELSEEEWSKIIGQFSIGLANITCMHLTDFVVLGGGVALNQGHRLDAIKKQTHELLHDLPKPEIVLSKLGDQAGLYGTFAAMKS